MRGASVALARRLPRVYWVLWWGMVANRVGTFVVPFLAVYLRSLDFTTVQAGSLASAYGVGALAAGLCGGMACDRWGSRTALLCALIATVATLCVIPSVHGFYTLTPLLFGLGLASEASRPAVTSLMLAVVPPSDRVGAMGLLYWGVNLGFSVAPLLAGLLATACPSGLFWGDAFTTLVFACLVWKGVSVQGAAAGPLHAGPGPIAAGSPAGFACFLAITFCGGLVFFQYLFALPTTMAAHGITAAQFGRVLALNGLLIALVQPLVTMCVGRSAPMTLLAVGTLLVGVGLMFNAWCVTPVSYAAALVVWTAGEMLIGPLGAVAAEDLAPVAWRARCQGLYQTTLAAAFAIAPALGAQALARVGAVGLWVGCGVIGVIGAACYWGLHRLVMSHQPAKPQHGGLPKLRRAA